MKDIEIEIQARVESVESLRNFLEQSARFVSEKRQVDEYFIPAHRDFRKAHPVQEWFRLRDEGGAFSMNYKKWHYDEQGIGQYADEFETGIEDREAAGKILEALNFQSIVVVDKTRKKWMYENYEVALDSVEGLGEFVEIEYKGNEEVDPAEVTRRMVQFLKDRGCGKIELNNGGYPYLLLFPEHAHFIEV